MCYRCQVYNSALNLFRELEMWDEVVTCYQLLQKPHRAELLVRERLAAGDETPSMVNALADLTNVIITTNRISLLESCVNYFL